MYTVFVLFHSYARLHVAPLNVARLSVAAVNCRPMNCRRLTVARLSVTESMKTYQTRYINNVEDYKVRVRASLKHSYCFYINLH